MALDASQRGVMRGMILAFLLGSLVLLAAILFLPAALMPLAAPADRLAAAARWGLLVVVCLIAAVGNLARHRFFTPADIDGSGLTAGSDRARLYQAIVQNTLEQALIAVIAHAAWAATMPVGWFGAVPAAAVLFLIGRIAFAAVYARGAPARAFGFALTFYPSVLLVVGALAGVVWRATIL